MQNQEWRYHGCYIILISLTTAVSWDMPLGQISTIQQLPKLIDTKPQWVSNPKSQERACKALAACRVSCLNTWERKSHLREDRKHNKQTKARVNDKHFLIAIFSQNAVQARTYALNCALPRGKRGGEKHRPGGVSLVTRLIIAILVVVELVYFVMIYRALNWYTASSAVIPSNVARCL